MNASEYNNLASQGREYYVSLSLNSVMAEFTINPLLNQNKKLNSGVGEVIPNFGLELTPANFANAEINHCPSHGSCLLTCLFFSGVAQVIQSKTGKLSNTLKKRIRRQYLFDHAKEFFIEKLTNEIKALVKLHGQKKVAIRLNVLNDIDWQKAGFDKRKTKGAIYYEYTKIRGRASKTNHIVYSASERDKSEYLVKLLNNKINVAIVFPNKKLPRTWKGFAVIDGNIDDRRYLDKRGVVVGLTQKLTQHGITNNRFISSHV